MGQKRKVSVFVDGRYRHGCSDHATRARRNPDYWGPKIAASRRKQMSHGADEGPGSFPDPLDHEFFQSLLDAWRRERGENVDEEDFDAFLTTGFSEGIAEATDRLVETLDKRAPRQLHLMRKQQRAFEKRLRNHWGPALDQYRILWVCMQEQGSAFNDRWQSDDDALAAALVGLHAKACRVAWEVLTLLYGGFAMGALARCRTLHEMAVIASILGDWHGPGPVLIPDLAERFAARAAVVSFKDALEYQRNAAALCAVPFTPSEMAEIERESKDAIARFGPLLSKKDYGWASGVGGKREPHFADLEVTAGLSHLRSYYKWASHEVHADATGVAANVVSHGDGQALLVGPSNVGLADPGQSALISLHQITATMLVDGGQSPGPTALIGLQAVSQMLDRACASFADAEADLHDLRRRARWRRWRRRLKAPRVFRAGTAL